MLFTSIIVREFAFTISNYYIMKFVNAVNRKVCVEVFIYILQRKEQIISFYMQHRA